MPKFLIDINVNDYISPKLQEVMTKFDQLTSKAAKPHTVKVETSQAEGGLNKLVGLAGRAFAAFGLFEAVKGVVKLGTDMEQVRIQFETFTGSAEKGNAAIAQLQKFAQVTPFDDEQVINSGRKLLAFGDDANSLIPTLTKLGNIASATPVALEDLVSIYGKNKLSGIIQSDDLNQLNDNGIPVIKSLAKQLGVAESGVRKMAESGKISFGMLDKAFEELGGAGGQWGNLMDKQSKSVAGKWSSLVGFAQNMGGKMGEALNPFLGKLLDSGSTLLTFVSENTSKIKEMFAPLVKAVQPLVDTFGKLWEQQFGTGEASSFLATMFNRVATVIEYLSPVVNVAATLLAKVWEVQMRVTTALGKFIDTSPRLQKFFSGLWNAAVTTFKGIAEAIGKYLGGVGDILEGVFSGDFGKMKSGLMQTLMAVADTQDVGMKAAEGFVDGYRKGFDKKSNLFTIAAKAEDAPGAFLSGKGKPAATSLAPSLSAATSSSGAGASSSSKVTHVSLHIRELVHQLTVQAATVTEGAEQVADIVIKKIMGSLNDVNVIASAQ